MAITAIGQEVYSVDYNEEPLEQILETLESEYGFMFSYKTAELKGVFVSVKLTTTDRAELMQGLLSGTDLAYELVDDNYIVLTPNRAEYQSLCFQVVDSTSGEALISANVYTADMQKAGYTDASGRVTLSHKFRPSDTILISYVGYTSKAYSIAELSSSNCNDIVLAFDVDSGPMLIIKGYLTSGIDLNESKGNTILRPALMNQFPGQVDPDVLRIVEFLPGISSPTSKASDIYVRGGTPDQNLILWEDIPIYHSAHYFGMITAIDPYMVDRVNVYRGGFTSDYGGRTASVIDIQTLDEKNKKSKTGIGANMTHSYLYSHQYFGEERPTAVSVSLRRSYDELLQTRTFKEITEVNQQEFLIGDKDIESIPDRNINIKNDFYFIDTHAKISSQWSKKDRVELSMLYAKNRFSDKITDQRVKEEQKDSMELNNVGISVKAGHVWSDAKSASFKTSIKAIATAYDYNYNYRLNELDNKEAKLSGLKQNMIQDRQVQIENAYSKLSGSTLKLGYHLINYDINYKTLEDEIGNRIVEDKGDSQSKLHALYLNYRKLIGKRLEAQLGLRGSYYNLSDKYYWEPRLRLAYKLSDAFTVSGNYGKHTQYVGQVEVYKGNNSGLIFPLWALAENRSIPIQEAQLSQLGLIYNKNGFIMDLQFYDKEVVGISSRTSSIIKVSPGTALVGKSNSRGVDLMVRKKFKNIHSWLSYSYSKTEMNFKRDNETFRFLADHDQTHVFNSAGALKLGSVQVTLGYKLSSGLPFSRLVDYEDKSEPGEPSEYELSYDGINRHRLPWMQELNFSCEYAFAPSNKKWKSYVNFSITNLLNNRNIYDKSYSVISPNGMQMNPTVKIINKYNLGFMPNVNIRFEW